MNALPGRLAAADEKIRRLWEERVRSEEVQDDEPYIAMGVLARVLCDRSTEPGADFADVFAAIEGEISAADGPARNLLIVGLLEDLQNMSLNQGRALDRWVHWMGPATLAGWEMVERLWAGSITPADFNGFVDG